MANQSLNEQLQNTDSSGPSAQQILFGLNVDSIALLQKYQSIAKNTLQDIINNFYNTIKNSQELNEELTICNIELTKPDNLLSLTESIQNYIMNIFDVKSDIQNNINFYNILYNKMTNSHKTILPKLWISILQNLHNAIITVMNHHVSSKQDIIKLQQILFNLIQYHNSFIIDFYIKTTIHKCEIIQKQYKKYANDLKEQVANKISHLEALTYKDELTGLYNRRAFYDLAFKVLKYAQKTEKSLSIIYLDLNNFKKINDQQGHQVGDICLQLFAKLLLNNIRNTDIAFRMGGDEFCILLFACNQKEADTQVQKIYKYAQETKFKIDFSIGISAVGPGNYCPLDQLITKADHAMYIHKRKNKSGNSENF